MFYYFNSNMKFRTKPVPSRKIYGASWDGSSSTTWTRTDDAANFSDPNPYYAGMSETPSSPFDDVSPWKDMVVSERTGGTMVAIPKFYYKLGYANENSQTGLKIQISMTQHDGFVCSPAHMDRGDGAGERDVIYVGRYHCGRGSKKSVSDVYPYGNITRSTARSNIHSLGSHIWILDFATRFTIWLLYLVEFADWDSQLRIGYGSGNGSIGIDGYSDNMPYHTGTTQSNKTTFGFGTQYRNMEGLWDNAVDFLDGCYNSDDGLNIILNPSLFSDSSGGILVGKPTYGVPSKFVIKNVNGTFPLIIPSEVNGTLTTYTTDYWIFEGASKPCITCGGGNDQLLNYGIVFISRCPTTYSNTSLSCRLMELP